jgi:hypothetical protein
MSSHFFLSRYGMESALSVDGFRNFLRYPTKFLPGANFGLLLCALPTVSPSSIIFFYNIGVWQAASQVRMELGPTIILVLFGQLDPNERELDLTSHDRSNFG